MSPRNDDRDVNRRRLDDRAAEALLSGRVVVGEPALAAFVQQLQSLADAPAPTPSSALAAMLEQGLDLPPVPAAQAAAVSWRTRSWALPLQVSLGGVAALSLVLVAAVGNDLPAPAQTAVANVVEAITPLHVPRPATHAPTPKPAVTPTETVSPAAASTAKPDEQRSPRPSSSAATGEHQGGPSGEHQGGQSGDRQVEPSQSPRPSPTNRSGEDHPTTSGGGEHHGSSDPTSSPSLDDGHSGDGSDGSGH